MYSLAITPHTTRKGFIMKKSIILASLVASITMSASANASVFEKFETDAQRLGFCAIFPSTQIDNRKARNIKNGRYFDEYMIQIGEMSDEKVQKFAEKAENNTQKNLDDMAAGAAMAILYGNGIWNRNEPVAVINTTAMFELEDCSEFLRNF